MEVNGEYQHPGIRWQRLIQNEICSPNCPGTLYQDGVDATVPSTRSESPQSGNDPILSCRCNI